MLLILKLGVVQRRVDRKKDWKGRILEGRSKRVIFHGANLEIRDKKREIVLPLRLLLFTWTFPGTASKSLRITVSGRIGNIIGIIASCLSLWCRDKKGHSESEKTCNGNLLKKCHVFWKFKFGKTFGQKWLIKQSVHQEYYYYYARVRWKKNARVRWKKIEKLQACVLLFKFCSK